MNTGALKSQDGEILMAAIFIAMTNWDSAEPRQGRRGHYLTTGALQLPRLRLLPETIKNSLVSTMNSIGMDLNEEDITEMFSGMHEYQISFAVNRFESKAGEGISLTNREKRAVDTVVELLQAKPDAVHQVFPELRKAG